MAVVELQEASRKVRELYNKGFAAMERNNLDYAIDMFLNVLEMEPNLLKARKFLRAAEMKKVKGKKANPLSSLKGVAGIMAVKSALKKDAMKALMHAEKLMKIDPLNKDFIRLLVEAAETAEMPEVAIQTMELAVEHYPKDVGLLERAGKLYLDNDDTKKARAVFETIVRLKPSDQKAIQDLKNAAALDTMNVGKWDTSQDYRGILKDSDQAQKLEQETRAQKSGSDVDSLIEETQAKVAREPNNINFLRALADLYSKAGKYDESLETYEKAHDMAGGADPQIEKAINRVKIEIYDHNIKILTEEGQTEEAEETQREKETFLLEDASDRVRRYPNDLQFKHEYGELLFKQGELNEAIQQFQASQRNPQRRLESLYYLGRCFKEKNQFDIAIEQFEKAAEEIPTMNNTKKDIFYELGMISEAMSNMPKATEYYKEIYAVDIGYKDVAEKIDQGYS